MVPYQVEQSWLTAVPPSLLGLSENQADIALATRYPAFYLLHIRPRILDAIGRTQKPSHLAWPIVQSSRS